MADVTTAPVQRESDGTPARGPVGSHTDRWSVHLESVLRTCWAGLVAGFVGGFLVGGVGGRIAMRIVTLQSDARFNGVTTDDGAQVGDITLTGTLVLVSFLTVAGAAGALAYLLLRRALPEDRRWRAASFAVFTGLAGGALVVDADGIDFAVLGHRWTSVALFVALPTIYGAVVSLVAERLLRPGGRAWTVPRWALPLPFVLLLPGLLIVPVALGLAAFTAARMRGWASWSQHPVRVWAVRALLLAVAAWSTVRLVQTLTELP